MAREMQPMLAATPETLTTLKYPVLASAKYDGIRCLVIDGKPVSRKLLAIPNRHIRRVIEAANLPALDGELIVSGSFQDVTSAVMSETGEPDFEYHVFDTFDPRGVSQEFSARIEAVAGFVEAAGLPWLKVVKHVTINNAAELVEYERVQVEENGFEGVMLRSPAGPYKFGRSTEREGYLMKVKRATTDEAEVIGFEEQMTNANIATTDALGHTKRGTSKAGMKGAGTLGALTVRNALGTFNVGTGWTAKQRAELWAARESLIGRTLTFKYNKAGMKDVPRFPVAVGFRDPRDMS